MVLLSAICVQKPLLAFQQAKLAFEAELMASGLTWSIVRPTAFFKSLSGQVARVQQGKPFLLFGDGTLTSCKPISDDDLAEFIATCVDDPARQNRVLPIGGPGDAMTPRQQGDLLFALTGKTPRFKRVPVGLLDVIIATLSAAGRFVPALRAKAELAKIGRYYASESMLVWTQRRSDTMRTRRRHLVGRHWLIITCECWLESAGMSAGRTRCSDDGRSCALTPGSVPPSVCPAFDRCCAPRGWRRTHGGRN